MSSSPSWGVSFRTKLGFGDAIRAASGGQQKAELSRSNALVLMAIAYFQPINRGELSQFLGREVSRDAIASLRGEGFIAAGPRSPTPAPPTPMSPRQVFWRNSAWRVSAICPTSRSSRTRGCSAGQARRFSTATRSRPSCEGCWDYLAATSRRTSRTKMRRKTILSRKKKQAVPRCAHRDFGVDLSG